MERHTSRPTRRNGCRTLYVKCTTDEYELPVVVADSPQELADKLGVTYDTVVTQISKHKAGFLRIDLDEEETEELDKMEVIERYIAEQKRRI